MTDITKLSPIELADWLMTQPNNRLFRADERKFIYGAYGSPLGTAIVHAYRHPLFDGTHLTAEHIRAEIARCVTAKLMT